MSSRIYEVENGIFFSTVQPFGGRKEDEEFTHSLKPQEEKTMKIVTSDLRMDASTGYRDVRGQAGLNSANRRTTGVDDQGFQLKLPISAGNGIEKQVERRSTTSGSSGGTNGDPAESSAAQHKKAATEVEKLEKLTSAAKVNMNDLQFGGSFEYSWEKISLATSGHVSTADGRDIDFSLNLSLERESFSLDTQFGRTRAGMFIDPLVLSFDNSLNMLDDAVFSFDLDCDGIAENIAGLRGCSGFLGLDINGDSIFNDGGELFGPRTGYAFDELRAYDEDGNNWLDENDPVFARLGLWMGAGGSEGRMLSLREAGVGALALASTENQFSLKNSDGRIVGRIDRSGIFLMEDGAVRSLQEIDLQDVEELQKDQDRLRNVETIPQALAFLRYLIALREHQLAHLTQAKIAEKGREEKEKGLAERFWEWQENNLEKNNAA